jgi:hypothetical protein
MCYEVKEGGPKTICSRTFFIKKVWGRNSKMFVAVTPRTDSYM